MLEDGPECDAADILSEAPTGFINNDVAHLGPGGAFGELALITEKPRMATIKALKRTHCITISRSDYQNTLKEIEKRHIGEMVNFLRNIPVFSTLSRTWLQNKMIQFLK